MTCGSWVTPGAAGYPDQPSVLAVAPGATLGFDEGVQARGGDVRDRCQPQSAGSAVVHLHRHGDEHLAVGAASLPAFRRIGLGAEGDRRLVDLHQAGKRRAVGRHRGAAQLAAQQPGRLVRAEPQLLLQLQGGDAVGMGGHQIRRPKPDGERQLRSVHHRPGGDRRLLAAAGALPGERLGRQFPAFGMAAVRATEAVGPARISQIRSTRPLVRKAALKLDERARIVGHGEPPEGIAFAICSTPSTAPRHHAWWRPDARG